MASVLLEGKLAEEKRRKIEAKKKMQGEKRRETGRWNKNTRREIQEIPLTAFASALLYYAERPKTKRQDTSRKRLKSRRKAGDQDGEREAGGQE